MRSIESYFSHTCFLVSFLGSAKPRPRSLVFSESFCGWKGSTFWLRRSSGEHYCREGVRSLGFGENSPRIATARSPTFPGLAQIDVRLAGRSEMRNQLQPMRLLSTAVGPDEKQKKETENKSIAKRLGSLLSQLEEVPLGALGLGLAGAIPFVGLTPGIVSFLPLPESLTSIHVEAQAAYGAVILTFLGGPHWGLAMADWRGSTTSKFSRQTLHTVRYVWSVIPSLVAWPALLLSPVPKLALLITTFGIVLAVDATFSRMGLLPTWYMPLRVLLTGIAMLSMTSSLIVTAATNVVTQ